MLPAQFHKMCQNQLLPHVFSVLNMDSTNGILLILLLTCIVIKFLLHSLQTRSKRSSYNLPPGPSFLTIVKSIVELGQKPQQTLANLARVHGPMIMQFKLGQVITIVISSPEIAKEVLQTHDILLSDRTIPQAINVHNHEQCCLPFLPISPLWRDLRKICYNQMFSKNSLESSQGLRSKKLQEFLSDVHTCGQNGEAIEIGRLAFKISINYLSNVFFSLDFVQSIGEIDELKDTVMNLAKAIGTPNLGDFFPLLKIVDPQGITKRTNTYIPKLFQIFDGYIDQRLKLTREEGNNYVTNNDMLDTLLNISQENCQKMDRDKIKHLFLDLVVAGTDTTTYALEQAMAELLHNPNTMLKAKTELQETIGRGKHIEESDIEKLPYLQAIIKETLRMHPPAPFLLPRKARDDVELCGYTIPKGAQVIINEWAICRSPNIWDDPNSFSPERFLGSKIDVKGHNFEFTPFGGGRRLCPGLTLGTRMLQLMLGSLINSFDWRLQNGVKVLEDVELDHHQLRATAIRINSS